MHVASGASNVPKGGDALLATCIAMRVPKCNHRWSADLPSPVPITCMPSVTPAPPPLPAATRGKGGREEDWRSGAQENTGGGGGGQDRPLEGRRYTKRDLYNVLIEGET